MRQYDRVPHLREVSIRTARHGRTAVGYMIDLSRGGAKFFTELSLSVGEMIEITWVEHHPAVTLGGRVVYTKSDADGLFAGMQFHQSLSEAAFQELRRHRPVARRA